MSNTTLSYLYRDANNFKQAETVVLSGILSEEVRAKILEDFGPGADGFVPSVFGLSDLQERFDNDLDPESDHPYHEVTDLETTQQAPTCTLSAEDFASRMFSTNWETEGTNIWIRMIS